ncbi:MAG: LemA family protein [Candidatus Saccharimonadales bacterium]
MTPLVAILIIAGVIVLFIVFTYNSLVKSKVRTEEAWSDINVQLKRRYDLIPNLVNTVKGYAKHEKNVFEQVTKARAQALQATGVNETAKTENQFEQALKSLFAVAEAYPDLKADENFQQLQAELVDTEDKIQAARRFYNSAVRELNIKVKVFPTNLFASILGFKEQDFFEVTDLASVKKPVTVDFNEEK